ncbi:MAG TPA: Wzz/FepE/Etk N-terminal domain-containing protein [Solirubrobacteraceae bacterium]|jgi:capsular polysaccharide biosynthesis protein
MNDTTDATAILAPIWRRKWLILLIAVLAGVGSYFYYREQPKVFQSQTELYLLNGSEEQQGEKGAVGGGKSKLNAAAQAQLITTVVRERVRKELRNEETKVAKQALKGKVRVKAGEKSSFLTITTEARTAAASSLYANTLARSYIQRQHTQYMRGLRRTITINKRQLHRLETPRRIGHGKGASTGVSATSELQAANLSTKINQLEAQLNVKAVSQINPAKPKTAKLLQPKPRKNAEFGFILGLILSAIAVFVLSRINRRLRTVGDLESALELPVLTVLPQVKTPILERDGAPAPARALVEPLRKLDVTLRLPVTANGGGPTKPRTVLFLSPETSEGASSVLAGLALIQREAGEQIAVVEGNLRRPSLSKLLRLEGNRGLLDVLAGSVPVSAVLQTVAAPKPAAGGADGETTESQQSAVATVLAQRAGDVSVLAVATGAPNPQALLASNEMTVALQALAQQSDRVLVDGPPPLEVSDAIPLLSAVDGIVLVVRLGHARDASARRLRQLLARTPSAPVIGVVANGAARKEVERYGSAGAVRRRLFRR